MFIAKIIAYLCNIIEANKAMSKSKKKRQNFNTAVIKALSQEYSLSEQFIRQCIRKERHSLTAETIRKKYHEMANATLQKIEEFKKQL